MSKSVFDEMLAGMGNAITDIREKVVEEGWFGRAVTDGQTATREASSPTNDVSVSSGPETADNAWQAFVDASRSPDTRDAIQPQEPDIDR